jgi:hypothetical protein
LSWVSWYTLHMIPVQSHSDSMRLC